MKIIVKYSIIVLVIAIWLDSSTVWAQSDNEPTIKDVPYGEDQKQKLDIYLPNGDNRSQTAVILVHGGGWGGGDKNEFAYIGHLAAMRGIVAIAVNYRLANGLPSKMWPAQLNDVELTVRWVRKNADSLKINRERVCALGSSAGGHLVIFLAALPTNDQSRVECAVDEFGPADLVSFFQTAPANLFGTVEPQELQKVLKEASPINLINRNTAPILVIQGSKDTQVKPEQSENLYSVLKKNGVPTKYIVYSGGHGFEGLSGSEYTKLQQAALDFITANASN